MYCPKCRGLLFYAEDDGDRLRCFAGHQWEHNPADESFRYLGQVAAIRRAPKPQPEPAAP